MTSSRAKIIRYLLTLLPLIIGGLILVLVNLWYVRFDLTRDKTYSLSPVTLEILNQLQDPVEVRYFLSPRLEREVPEVQLIRDLLEEMQRSNSEHFSFRVLDPEADGLQTPEDLGITPQQYQVVEANEQSIATVYTGVVITYRDEFYSIPLVIDPRTFEYDLLRGIKELTDTRVSRVGVLFGDSSLSQNHQVFLSTLSSLAEVSVLTPGQDFPPGISALYILGQKDLVDADFERVDNLLSLGRSVFFGFDYHRVSLTQGLEAIEGVSTPGIEFLARLGIELQPLWVLDSENQPIPIQQSQGRVTFSSLEPYDLWPRITTSGIHSGHPTTSRLQKLDVFWASPLELGTSELLLSTEFVPIFSGSPDARLMGPPLTLDPRALPFGTPFSDNPPILGYAYEGEYAGQGGVRLVVLGDQDLFSDLLQINQSEDNLLFAQNTTEWLLGDDQLLSIRSKQFRESVLVPGGGMVRILAVVFGPGLFALGGLLMWFRRRRRA